MQVLVLCGMCISGVKIVLIYIKLEVKKIESVKRTYYLKGEDML